MQPIITPPQPPAIQPAAVQPPRNLRSLRTLRSLARRARQLGPSAIPLFTKAFVLLLAARLALRPFPVARIIAWKQQPVPSSTLPDPEAAATRARIRHAILTIARYSPIRFVCFPQCLAAAALLRAHGLPSRLHYGITRDSTTNKLITHTWLETGNQILIGGEAAPQYSTLAIY